MLEKDIFFKIFRDALETEVDCNLDTTLEEIEEWDSIGKLSFISEMDSEFDITLSPQKLDAAVTVNDLYLLVNSN